MTSPAQFRLASRVNTEIFRFLRYFSLILLISCFYLDDGLLISTKVEQCTIGPNGHVISSAPNGNTISMYRYFRKLKDFFGKLKMKREFWLKKDILTLASTHRNFSINFVYNPEDDLEDIKSLTDQHSRSNSQRRSLFRAFSNSAQPEFPWIDNWKNSQWANTSNKRKPHETRDSFLTFQCTKLSFFTNQIIVFFSLSSKIQVKSQLFTSSVF